MIVSPSTAASASPRQRRSDARLLRFGEYAIDQATRELLRDGVAVPVRRQVFDLLLLLVQRRPQTVSREELRRSMGERGAAAGSAVARAVLEARRAIGDPQDDPKLIVNVHGVGYRFAGELSDGAPAAPAAPLVLPASPLARARSQLQDAAAACDQRNDLAAVRYHAEVALAEALRHQLDAESGHALCWLGWLALWTGAAEDAALQVGYALQVASRAGQALLQARADTVDAALQLTLGRTDEAMHKLIAAHPLLLAAGKPAELFRCEHLLYQVARELGDHEAATDWVRQAGHTARTGMLPLAVRRAGVGAAQLQLDAGDRLQHEGRLAEARVLWHQALDATVPLLAPGNPDPDPGLTQECLAQRANLLGRLARFAEARAVFDALRAALHAPQPTGCRRLLEQRLRLQADLARLALREADHVRALDDVRAGIELAGVHGYDGPAIAPLYALGSEVAEHCAQFELALRWARSHRVAEASVQGQRARLLLQVLQARSQHAALQHELESARQRMHFLERMNAELLQRLHGPLSSLG